MRMHTSTSKTSSRLGYNHFLSLPITIAPNDGVLTHRLDSFRDAVQALALPRFDTAAYWIPSERYHLTLAMLRVYGAREKRRLAECVRSWAGDLRERVLEARPLVVGLRGVGIMRGTEGSLPIGGQRCVKCCTRDTLH